VVAVLGLKCARSYVSSVTSGLSGAVLSGQYSSALPSKNRCTYGYAREYVAIVAGHIRKL
jgi:hypothetical protein